MDTLSLLTSLFISTSAQYHLPAGLLESLCFVESSHKVQAVHKDDGGSDSIGLCQIKLETAQWLGFKGDAIDLMAPKINIQYAAKYLAYQRNRYNGSVQKAVIAYNIGHAGGLTRTVYSDKVFKQWRSYNVKRVQNNRKSSRTTIHRTQGI